MMKLDAADVHRILEHLVTANDLNLLYGLPLIPKVSGGHASLSRGRSKYTLATEEEGCLFTAADGGLLALSQLSSSTTNLLLNSPLITPVRPIDVVRYMTKIYNRGRTTSISVGVKAQDIEHLAQFWAWLSTWQGTTGLFADQGLIQDMEKLHLIPLDVGSEKLELRRAAAFVLDVSSQARDLTKALKALGLPTLHPTVTISGAAQTRFVKDVSDVRWMLDALKAQGFNSSSLSQAQRTVLHGHFTRALSTPGPSFTSAQQATLRQLPIFPTLPPGVRVARNYSFDVAPTPAIFVDGSVTVVPHTPGQPFIQYAESRSLAAVLGVGRAEGEISILEMVVNSATWMLQTQISGLADLLVKRIISRLNDFSPQGRNNVQQLPIVAVAGNIHKCPAQVVDPKSPIAALYDPGDMVLPTGVWAHEAPGSYINQLRNYGMLQSELSESVLSERIGRFGNAINPISNREAKSLHLLNILDTPLIANQLSQSAISTIHAHAWLPAGGRFHRPSECWDNRTQDARLCDLVLPLVQKGVHTASLRQALGWMVLPFDKIQEQFLAVVKRCPVYPLASGRTDASYIIPLLQELTERLASGACSQVQIQELADAIGDAEWVPISTTRCIGPCHAMLDAVDLGNRFHRVHSTLVSNAKGKELLGALGIANR